MRRLSIAPQARFFLKLAFLLVIIGYAAHSIDIPSFISGIRQVRSGIYLGSVSLTVIYFAGLALTTNYLMGIFGVRTNYADMVILNYVTIFYAHVSQAIGTLHRWIALSGPLGRRGEAAIVIVYERLQSFFICLLYLCLVAFFGVGKELTYPFLGVLAWTGVGCLIAIGLGMTCLRSFVYLLVSSIKSWSWKSEWIRRVFDDAKRVIEMVGRMSMRQHLTAALPQILCSMLILVRFYMLAHSVNEPLSWPAVIALYALVRLVEVVPFFIMGIGLQEGIFVFLLPHLGMSREGAVLFALMHLGNVFILVVIGGVLSLLRRKPHAQN